MPSKSSSSHFIAHVVTAFVNRLSEAIHEVAAARAHSQMLRLLGGPGKHQKHVGPSRPLRAKMKQTDAVETEKPAKRMANRRPERKAKKTVDKAAGKAAKVMAKQTKAKPTLQLTTKKVRAQPNPATRAKAAATSRAVAKRAKAKRKDGGPPLPTRTQRATLHAGALIPTEPPAAPEAPSVPPETVVATADAAPATAG